MSSTTRQFLSAGTAFSLDIARRDTCAKVA
jgi:hypothetical protein